MDNFALAILPANIAFVTPLAFTLRESELVSIELSSTFTLRTFEAYPRPSPAAFEFIIEPSTALAAIVSTPLLFNVASPLIDLLSHELEPSHNIICPDCSEDIVVSANSDNASLAATESSTYFLILCCVANEVALSLLILSSSRIGAPIQDLVEAAVAM